MVGINNFYYMKNILLVIVIILSCKNVFGQNLQQDNSVGFIENDKFFIKDSIICQQKVLDVFLQDNKDLQISKTEIKNITTIGEKNEQAYFIQFTTSKNAKIARYLFLIENNFYFFEDLKNKDIYMSEEVFYNSYYVCYGSDDPECAPNIAYVEGELTWGAGTKIACNPNSPCKTAQVLLLNE